MGTQVDFKTFFAIYAELEQFDHIPSFHVQVCDFLAGYDDWQNSTAVLEVFRNGAKSTIVAVFVVWLLVNDPSLIFLISSADDNTAGKMVSDIKKIINIHPLAVHLRGAEGEWSARKVRVRGSRDGRNVSVEARGIFSNVVGSREVAPEI